MAELGVGAVDRIKPITTANEVFQFLSEGREFVLSRPDLAEFGREKIADVGAGRDALAAHVENGGDLDQGEAGALSSSDELESGDDRGVVVAVAVRIASRLREQTLAFVEPDRLGIKTCGGGDFSNVHVLDGTRLTLYLGSRFTVTPMDVTLLYFEGCPNWKIADERLRLVAVERPDITVRHQVVDTPEQADRVGFLGSPSIQVDGVDVFAAPGSQVGLMCRLYPTPDGYQGAPTLDQLRTVLADA